MRTPLPVRRRLHTILSIAVWAAAAAGAFLLHRYSGGGDALAVAEAKEYRVSPSELGRILTLEVAEGQRVSAGQVMARLETETIRREIKVAQARLQHAASEVRSAGASLDVSLLQSERAFESEIEAAEIDLQAAQSGSARERAELDQLSGDIQRQRDLVRRGLARADRLAELELRRAALDEAVRAWPPRIAALERRHGAAELRLAEWRRTHASAPGGSRQALLQPAHEKVREQDASLRLLSAQLRNSELLAPADGYVSLIQARPGDVVQAGQPVLTLVGAQPRQMVAYVEERRGEPLPAGAKVLARRRAGARQEFEATVTVVGGDVALVPPRARANPGVLAWGRAVYIELPPGADLDPGETVEIRWLRNGTAPGRRLSASR